MIIPAGLYQFEDERALIIVTGKQVGRLFYARNGRISEVGRAFVPTPRYSDREGFFARSGRGQTYGSGAVYEPKDQEAKQKFIRLFGKKIGEVAKQKNSDAIYLFAPNYEITELKERLGPRLRKLIKLSSQGNIVKFGPLEAAERINGKLAALRRQKAIPPTKAEAKIIRRPRETPLKARRQAVKIGKS